MAPDNSKTKLADLAGYTSLADLKTIEQAARDIGMDRARLRMLCIASGVAIRWGGTDKHPRLKVRMRDVERVVLAQKYKLPAVQTKGRATAPATVFSSDLRC